MKKLISLFLIMYLLFSAALSVNANNENNTPYLEAYSSTGIDELRARAYNLPDGDYICVYVLYGGAPYGGILDYEIKRSDDESLADLGNNSIYFQERNESYVKLFCWDSLENMQPVCEPLTYSLRNIDYKISRDSIGDESIVITMLPEVGMQIVDYIELIFWENDYNEEHGYYDGSVPIDMIWEDYYNTNLGKAWEILPGDDVDVAEIVPLNGKTQLEVKQNGMYIFHAVDKSGKDVYQGVNLADKITTPHIENVEVTVDESNFKADITFDFISNPLAGETKMAMKKHRLNYYTTGSTATTESMVQGFFENYKGEYITGNKITVTENAQYHIYCIDEWGNGSFYIVKVNSIPDIAYTLSRNEVGNEPVTISFNPKTGEVVDYIPETYIYNPANPKSLEKLYKDNIKETEPILLNGSNSITVNKNGLYILHGADSNGSNFYREVEINNLITPPSVSNVSISLNEDNKTAVISFDKLSNLLAREVKFGITKDYYALSFWSERMGFNNAVKKFFDSPKDYGLAILAESKAEIDSNGFYYILSLDEWGNASYEEIHVDCIPKGE